MKIYFYLLIAIISISKCFAQEQETLKDFRDGHSYKIVQIAGKQWMGENLKFDTKSGSWCYDNNDSICFIYGRLYTWDAAKNACPSGWHLPTEQDWQLLEETLGMPKEKLEGKAGRGEMENIGGKLKSTDLWKSRNKGATNEYKFNALPAGFRDEKGKFSSLTEVASFWAATEKSKEAAWYRCLYNEQSYIARGIYYKTYAYSVRCLKN